MTKEKTGITREKAGMTERNGRDRSLPDRTEANPVPLERGKSCPDRTEACPVLQGQCEEERTSFTCGAFCPDGTVMFIDDTLTDSKTESGSLDLPELSG